MWMTPNARATCRNEGVSWFGSSYDNSLITEPITLKLRMHVGTHLVMHLHVTQLGCYCTCACAGYHSQISRTAVPIALKFGTPVRTG